MTKSKSVFNVNWLNEFGYIQSAYATDCVTHFKNSNSIKSVNVFTNDSIKAEIPKDTEITKHLKIVSIKYVHSIPEVLYLDTENFYSSHTKEVVPEYMQRPSFKFLILTEGYHSFRVELTLEGGREFIENTESIYVISRE